MMYENPWPIGILTFKQSCQALFLTHSLKPGQLAKILVIQQFSERLGGCYSTALEGD